MPGPARPGAVWLRMSLVAIGLAFAGCDASTPRPDGGSAVADAAAAASVFVNADGSRTRIVGRPTRILSTSVAATGTLLAIDAPLVASAAAHNGDFFGQWADIARSRGVRKLWPAGSVDLEAALAMRPDLILIARGGADSAMDQVDALRAIAPTIIVDYGKQTWQSLARILAVPIGREAEAERVIADFEQRVAEARARIRVPAGKANIISYNGPGMTNPVATSIGIHGRLLASLGFEIEDPDPRWSAAIGPMADFVRTPYEMLPRLTAATTFLLQVSGDRLQDFLADPVLATIPSVRSRQVYPLGAHAFRIDYYSAREVVDGIVAAFGR